MTTVSRANQLENAKPETDDLSRRDLYTVAGAAGSIAALVLLLALISLIGSMLRPNAANSWFSSFQNIWLIVIFKLHAGFRGVQIDLLHELNYLDLAILAIAGIVHLGLYTALKPTGKIWAILAVLQPFLGILLFIATKNAGRSGVMGAALVASGVMLRSDLFEKATAYLGILASLLLLAGDFSAGVVPPMTVMAVLVGIGYALLTAWFCLVARTLFRLGLRGHRDAK